MAKEVFAPNPILVQMVVDGFKTVQGFNYTPSGHKIGEVNCDIETVEDYIDSMGNPEVANNRDEYARAAKHLMAMEPDVMEFANIPAGGQPKNQGRHMGA